MGCVLSSLVAKFAFFPPTPPTYAVRQNDSGRQVAVPAVGPGGNSTPYEESSMDVWVLDTKSGNKVVAFYMGNPYARLTLLYSHGNAADLGQLYDLFTQLKVNLRVNLMGYDYSGYGASTGKPSESNTYADIEAVYQCLETEYGVSQEDLILYGQSVGSGPTLHLAAQLPRLRGVVLHSAILSGLRVVCHVKCMFCLDMYKNVNKIRKVKSPVLVIHGTDDDVVSWRHGNKLWKLSREPYDPLWIKGGGHCNLEIYPDYIRHLRRFVLEMENVTTSIRLKKVWPRIQNQATSSWYCCRVKFCRPSYPKCSAAPSCPKCFCHPKWPECLRPSCSCGSCCPKCLWGLKFPGCHTKCFYKPKWPEYLKFSCSCFSCGSCSCGSCLWKLKCPKCCTKCFCELNRPECLRPGCSCSCGSCCPWRPKCFCKPRCLECLRPKCPECLRPKCSCSCGSCCPWRPKCFCKPRCLECMRPKCPECLTPSCSCGSCCPRRLKCFCKLKCLECLKPNCSGCSRPKCSKCCCCIQKCLPCGCFGGSCNGNDDGRQDGQS